MRDPFGAVVTLLRADAAIAAIAGTRVSSEVQATPCIQVIDNSSTVRPYGPGSGRVNLQLWRGIARCWSADSPSGAIQARQLAGAVIDAMHNLPPVKVGTTYIGRAYAPEMDGITRDPDTRRPFYDVLLEVYAGAQAVA